MINLSNKAIFDEIDNFWYHVQIKLSERTSTFTGKKTWVGAATVRWTKIFWGGWGFLMYLLHRVWLGELISWRKNIWETWLSRTTTCPVSRKGNTFDGRSQVLGDFPKFSKLASKHHDRKDALKMLYNLECEDVEVSNYNLIKPRTRRVRSSQIQRWSNTLDFRRIFGNSLPWSISLIWCWVVARFWDNFT